MSIAAAVSKDLRALPATVRDSGLAEAARGAASLLDLEPGARDYASLMKELRATMAELRALAALAPEQEDALDRLEKAGPSNVLDFPRSVSSGA